MSSNAARIGFDRFIDLDWLMMAVRVRLGEVTRQELTDHLSAAGLGDEARAKTLTKLNGLCLAPRQEIDEFIGRGIMLVRDGGTVASLVYAWGAAIVAYPFFGKVAEITGRLSSLHGDCTTAEIHRRMSEVYGDRAVVKRATQAVLQTQANWGVLERVEGGTRIMIKPAMNVKDDASAAWLLEAVLRHVGKPVPRERVWSLSANYPFVLEQSLAVLAPISPTLGLDRNGTVNQFVTVSIPFRPTF